MSRTITAALLIVVSTFLLPITANAIVVTLDDDSLEVVRPASGTATVNFTGQIQITDGFRFTSVTSSSLWNSSGDLISGVFPRPTFLLSGNLFSVTFDSTDLGLYNLDSTLASLAYIIFSECPIGGGFCNNTGRINYSLNVLAEPRPVPEPATLVLSVMGLVGLGVAARRRRISGSRP